MQIAKAVCQVAAPAHGADRYKANRPCVAADSHRYVAAVESAFDVLPPFAQAQFCSVKRIYIESDFFGPAWSAPASDDNAAEILIGLRKADLDRGLGLEATLTAFEQQSFGDAGAKSLRVVVKPDAKAALPGLVWTLLHELGHTFDYRRTFNRPKSDVKFAASWTALSWDDLSAVSATSDFKERRTICLNRCSGAFIAPAGADALYAGLMAHGFVSQLAATNAMDDFADSFAYWVMSKYLGVELSVVSGTGKDYSSRQLMSAPVWKAKLDYLSAHF